MTLSPGVRMGRAAGAVTGKDNGTPRSLQPPIHNTPALKCEAVRRRRPL